MENNVMEQTQETKKTLFSVEQNGFTSYYDMGVMSFEELRKHFMESEHPFMGLGGKELSEADFAQMEQSDMASLSVTADIDNDVIQIYEINGISEEERTDENTRTWEMELSEYISPIKQAEINTLSDPDKGISGKSELDGHKVIQGRWIETTNFPWIEPPTSAGDNRVWLAEINEDYSLYIEETSKGTTLTVYEDRPYDAEPIKKDINIFPTWEDAVKGAEDYAKEDIDINRAWYTKVPLGEHSLYIEETSKGYELSVYEDGTTKKYTNIFPTWKDAAKGGKDYVKAYMGTYMDIETDTLPNPMNSISGKDITEKQDAMGQAEEIINRLESTKSVFYSDERNLIVNYAYQLNDIEKTRELAERIYYNHGNQEAILAKREAQAEIDALPDPMIGISQMNEYGYTYKDMFPLTQERALELFEQNLSVYVLHKDGTETVVEDREQIMEHAGIFGIEKDEWRQMLGIEKEESLQMHPQKENREAANRNKSQEQTEKNNSLPEQSNKKEAVQQAEKKGSVLSKLKSFQNKAKEQNEAKETPTRNKETSISK